MDTKRKICTRVRYNNRPLHGLIRVSRFLGKDPVEYTLKLFDERKGLVTPKKNVFRTAKEAIGHASLYGFSFAFWKPEDKEI